MDGFIQLHRKTIDSWCFQHPLTLKIWIWILLKASWKGGHISLNVGKGTTVVTLKRGELIFGRKKGEATLGIDESTLYVHLQKLKENGNIKIQSTKNYSIITIINYDKYQKVETLKARTDKKATASKRKSNSRAYMDKTKSLKQRKELIREAVKEYGGSQFPYNMLEKVVDDLCQMTGDNQLKVDSLGQRFNLFHHLTSEHEKFKQKEKEAHQKWVFEKQQGQLKNKGMEDFLNDD